MSFLPLLLRFMLLTAVIVGLARPQLANKTTEILSEGIDILLTIDTSGSMKALDFKLNQSEVDRLDVAKSVIKDFISRRSHDRIGMVVFGEKAYTQCPLTLDASTLFQFLNWIQIGIVGDGTAIGNALATSVKRLKDQKTKSKIIILLTDGRNNAGEVDPLTAAQIAKEFGIKIYTIGIGSHGPVPYPQETPLGVRRIFAKLDFDEKTLQKIADLTEGRYFRATDTQELETIYETIDQLEKTEVKVKEYLEVEELYPPVVFLAMVFLLIEVVLSQTIFLKIP